MLTVCSRRAPSAGMCAPSRASAALVARAKAWNDPERAARAREAMEFVARELSAAVGLGGTFTRARSEAEAAAAALLWVPKLASRL